MRAPQVLQQLKEAGGELRLRDGKLRVRARERLPNSLLNELREHKPDILEYLSRLQHEMVVLEDISPDLDDYQAGFYERASIAEFDGRIPRELAEREALNEMLLTYEQMGIEGQVRCIDCRHFLPDPAGCGGVGECEVQGEGTRSKALPLYPKALRHCRDFVARFDTTVPARRC